MHSHEPNTMILQPCQMCGVGPDTCPFPPPGGNLLSSCSTGEGRFHRKGDSLVSFGKLLSAVNRIDVGLFEIFDNLESGI
jgi:hypothetical protein